MGELDRSWVKLRRKETLLTLSGFKPRFLCTRYSITVPAELMRLVSPYTNILRSSNEKLAVPASPLPRLAWPLTV